MSIALRARPGARPSGPAPDARIPGARIPLSSALSLILTAAVLALAVGCKTAPPPPPPSVVPPAERPYVVDPLEGYPLTAGAEAVGRVRETAAALDRGVEAATVAAAADALAADLPGFHPAAVVAAQARLVAGDAAAARDRLLPVTDELPEYTAAQLVLGRAAEGAGDPAVAYRAYRAASRTSALAASRAADLREAAVAATHEDFAAALARGHEQAAAEVLADLEDLDPAARPTLEARVDLAALRGDEAAELAALRALHATSGDEREVVERLAELEVATGELAAGVERFESLVAAYPDDAALQDALEAARFRWRLDLLPQPVRELAGEPVLDRGDVATLLYWLFPEIRYATVEDPPVATDVLDHPRRDELLRVIGLALLDVDATIHRFHPERDADRGTVLAALLRLLERGGGDLACLREPNAAGADPGAAPWVCRQAAACGLLATVGDCLADAPVSGGEALELVRRTLALADGS